MYDKVYTVYSYVYIKVLGDAYTLLVPSNVRKKVLNGICVTVRAFRAECTQKLTESTLLVESLTINMDMQLKNRSMQKDKKLYAIFKRFFISWGSLLCIPPTPLNNCLLYTSDAADV